MKNIPIYDKTVAYAMEHGELDARNASYKANNSCSAAITNALHKHYNDYRIDTASALKELTERFSLERIAVVTAVSIRDKKWDGRISDKNKEWANSIPFPRDYDDWGIDRNSSCDIPSVNPGIIDLFATTVRKELERTKTIPLKKPSLVEKLNRPLPQKSDKSEKAKGQEL